MIFYQLLRFSCTCTILYGVVLISALEGPIQEDDAFLSSQEPPAHDTDDDLNKPLPSFRVPYASSPLYLTRLAQTEQYIYSSLLQYEIQLEQRLEILQRLRADYESSVLLAMQQIPNADLLDDWSKANAVSTHPILAHRMIRRFSKDLQAFTQHIWQSLENELWENLELHRSKFSWPSQDDLTASTKSLIKLQETHDFDIHQFTDGATQDHAIQVGLTARQCLEISETALDIGNINAATEWFQAAHFKGVNGYDNSISMDELTQAWETTFNAFQSIWPMQVFTTHDVFKEAKEMLQNDFNRVKGNLTMEHVPVNFKALCRGENLLSEVRTSDLTCYLENTIHPYYFMNPLKIEMYSWEPLVYKVHDFVGANVIGNLSHVVVPAMVSVMEAGHEVLQSESTGKTYISNLLPDSASPFLTDLTKKIDWLPGLNVFQLNTVSSDNYQISAFAVGNHYEPCTECFKEDANIPAVRNVGTGIVSTVHIVLYEPQIGGDLAFPLLGVTITPTIGSAIVHNEIDLLGNTDKPTVHGACPVLIGEKWVATKSIYQVLKDPISKKMDST